MSERMQRIARKQAHAAAQIVSHDEQLTRQRVDGLEMGLPTVLERIAKLETDLDALIEYAAKTERLMQELANWRAFSSFWQRLRWLLTGR